MYKIPMITFIVFRDIACFLTLLIPVHIDIKRIS